ncbi:MAG: glycerol-3-phosphate dehydrogenase/oxidase, partial [Planctomycetota bacterium]
MNRAEMIPRLQGESFEVLVVGGGATGLGVAVDAASRGYRTALIEAHDFAKATSSRSTKLVHGGVRYLEQLNFSLVMEALRERGIMYHNAPHLVSNLAFVVPRYQWWEGPFYGIGMKLYDALAGKLNLEASRTLSRDETMAAIPNVQQDGLLGGIMYHDGQFDDARMAITLARTAVESGAALANYVRATGFLKQDGLIAGVEAVDEESGATLQIKAEVTINATGIFSDAVRRLDDPQADEKIEPAQGVHLVLDGSFGAGGSAIMVPHTDDGRVLFVIPWHERVIVGTTDTPMPQPHLEPRALPEEVDFILRNANRYLEKDPTRDDVLSVFAGQRPLVHPGGKSSDSKSISRSHEVFVSASGLVTISGGKWTTYRQMAEDTLRHAIE